MKELALAFWDGRGVSFGSRVMTAATALRWVGWGFAESLIPVFLFMFAGSFAEAGLIRSAYDIAYILALPVVGVMADRVRPTTIVLIGLSLYVFVGTGYLLAGLTGMAIWIVAARLFNGVGYAMDTLGRETYFRRNNPAFQIATVFGYFDSVTNFFWALAALAGIFLVKYFELHWLLFMIVPTVIVAIWLVWKWARPTDTAPVVAESESAEYRNLLREFAGWHWKLKLLVAFNFVTALTGAIVAFFVPIEMYLEGSGYVPIIVMGVVTAVPAFFGWGFGRLFDREGPRTFAYGLIAYAVLLTFLGYAESYVWQIAIVFLIGLVQEFIYIGKEELVTTYASAEHFGRVGGLMKSIVNVGSLVGPLAAGIMIDRTGASPVYYVLALLMLAMAGAFVLVRSVTHRREAAR